MEYQKDLSALSALDTDRERGMQEKPARTFSGTLVHAGFI